MNKNPLSIVKYILFKCAYYGDVITNLKMQKVLYYIHVWHLVLLKKRCFKESFQAWPNGPVLRSVYSKLKIFGSSPINPNFSGLTSEQDVLKLKEYLGAELVKLIDNVYEKYGSKSAFELVSLTHNDQAWIKARKGLGISDPSKNEILDKDITSYYGKER